MNENFILSSQQKLYLFLEEKDGVIDALTFNFSVYKYGYPNDEIGHPLQNYGLGFYGFYEVFNSHWIAELLNQNRAHAGHQDSYYSNRKHYIAKYKDVTLEVISCGEYELTQIKKEDLLNIVSEEIKCIKNER